MIDLRIGDELFGSELSDGRKPKASVGAAFIDSNSNVWILVPKLFLTESSGNIFAGATRKVVVSVDLSNAAQLKAPHGGFACVPISSTVKVSPHPSSPAYHIPSVLDYVTIGDVSGQISGNASNFILPNRDIEPSVFMVSYSTDENIHPNIGSTCCIDDNLIGVTLGVSIPKRLAAVVPWAGLCDRFAALGLTPAQDLDLRIRNRAIGIGDGSSLNGRAAQLAEWLEALLDGNGGFPPTSDPVTRLITAIERLRLRENFDSPLPLLPQTLGGIRPLGWQEMTSLKEIREIAIGVDRELVSSQNRPTADIFLTAADLIATVFTGMHERKAGGLH